MALLLFLQAVSTLRGGDTMTMSRCPYLDYESNSYISRSSDKYICKLTGQQMDYDDRKVEYTCNCSEYEKCPYYKNR